MLNYNINLLKIVSSVTLNICLLLLTISCVSLPAKMLSLSPCQVLSAHGAYVHTSDYSWIFAFQPSFIEGQYIAAGLHCDPRTQSIKHNFVMVSTLDRIECVKSIQGIHMDVYKITIDPLLNDYKVTFEGLEEEEYSKVELFIDPSRCILTKALKHIPQGDIERGAWASVPPGFMWTILPKKQAQEAINWKTRGNHSKHRA